MDAFHEIFRELDRELWLISAQAGERRSGLIATYVAKVSLVPSLPRVTIALARHHFTHELIEASHAFCMHLMDESQIDWVWRFGIRSGREFDKLQNLKVTTGDSGAPILSDAPAWVDCRVEARLDSGDRTIYVADVINARVERRTTPLTFKRLLEIAPADKLQEVKNAMEHDIELDRAAILEWRQRK